MAAIAAPVDAQGTRTVLVLHTFGQNAPSRAALDAGFARTIREAAAPIDLYVETLDGNRFSDEQVLRTRVYLREKYADKNIAVAAAVFDSALAFLLDEREPIFPDVPIAALLTARAESLPDRVAVLQGGTGIGHSIALALTLQPRATQIAIIDGAPPSPVRDAVSAEIDRQVKALGLRLPVSLLRNQPLDEVLARVEALEPETIILVVTQFLGRNREPIAQGEALREIARVASGPVYVTTDALIGYGAPGGVVVGMDGAAAELAKLTLRLAAGAAMPMPAQAIIPVPMFDWRQLRRWNIRETLLPAGSRVEFRQLTVWDQYKVYIIAASAVVALQSALITGLVVQRARRKRVERQNHLLAGRLIDAQEMERGRIARDLHDDLSQQLAGLAIMLSTTKRKVESQPEIHGAIAALQERTAAAATTVRNLSHQLHPSVLQHGSLVEALRHLCAEVEHQYQLNVSLDTRGQLDALTAEVALCLYRVSQEALANAVRHGRAHTVRVDLMGGAETFELVITDDGVGFDHTRQTGTGLGLRSIAERVRFLSGRVTIQSRSGGGTVMRVLIPRPG